MPESPPPLRAFTDTYVNNDTAKTRSANYSRATKLALDQGAAYAFLYVNNPIPRGAQVVSAKLRLYRASTWSGSATITARRLSSTFSASRTIWTRQPGVTGDPSLPTVDPGGAVGGLVEIDVKNLLQAVASGAAWHGFRVESSNAAIRWLYSAEGASAYKPSLVVSWVVPPAVPTGLAPFGNKAVSTAKPLLRFQAPDVAAVKVQVSATADFASPWDSGWVTTDVPQLDLSTTSYPGIAVGSSVYWRAMVRDSNGLECLTWSAAARFTRQNLSTVTITNPAAGSSPFVTEPTPPILWTTPATQTAYQVLITKASDPTAVKADSGVRQGSDVSWTVPEGVLTHPGPWRVYVRMWDDVDRDPIDAYVETYRDFTVVDSSSVAGVVDLAVAQPNPWPGVRLSWTRSTAPDSFVIVRDGVTIHPEVLPEDALKTGTSYEWVDPGARVWQPHTWRVKAKVNGVQSESILVSLTPKSRGIWLLDEERGRRVWLAGDNEGDFTRQEDATTVTPLGASKAVRRVQGLQGYEGSLGGRLVDAHGRTAASYEADLYAMRDEPDRPVVLAVADLTLRVVLGSIQTAPTQTIPPSRVVAFQWWEA